MRTAPRIAAAGAAALALSLAPAAHAQADTVAPASTVPASAEPAPAPPEAQDSSQESLTLESTGTSQDERAAAPVCFFDTKGDYVHVSSSAFEASGHGWWINGDCDATHAVVTVQLQQYYGDGVWRNEGTPGQATVRSGGGAGNRATGRMRCSNSELTGWRSVIDVDLVGVLDTPDSLTTPSRNINCEYLR